MKKNFIFGVSASAYQIEGAFDADGKGLSIWDDYVRQDGKIFGAHTGDVACNHYNNYKQDIALMKQMGVQAYRFSIAWTRILPNGIGKINQKGLDFYNKLIDELVENGIEPYVTLYHWDMPLDLYNKGGFSTRQFADWFCEYAKVVVENFSNRVKYFITFNEPQCIFGSFLGNNHAPGVNLPKSQVLQMIHNMLLAHGKAVDVMRACAKQPIKISIAPTGSVYYPQTNLPKDLACAKQWTFDKVLSLDTWYFALTLYTEPIMFGSYSDATIKYLGEYLPKGWQDDMSQIHRPMDFYCQNYYEASPVSAKEGFVPLEQGCPRNSLGWAITPQGIYWQTKWLYERYNLPIVITENGICGHEWVSADGKVYDQFRIDYIKWHVEQLQKAVDQGVDVQGYFYWSFMDNFEWAEGYKERFGLVFVDYATQKRVVKQSGYWYKNLIEQHKKQS